MIGTIMEYLVLRSGRSNYGYRTIFQLFRGKLRHRKLRVDMNTQSLRCFNPNLPFKVTYRHLPHWEQDGVCAFVTLRLGDSVPTSVHQSYRRLREHWCRQRGMKEETSTTELLLHCTDSERRRFQRLGSSLYQDALDKGAGECVFRDPAVRECLLDTLEVGRQNFFSLGAGVIMPNHVHILIQPNEGESLSKILASIRKVSARGINKALGRTGELWQPEPFDHLIRSPGKYRKFCAYIRANPSRAKLRKGEYVVWE